MNLETKLRSIGMRYFSAEKYQQKQRLKARKARSKANSEAIVHYFHQVDDPYSHLSVQKLDLLRARYDLLFQPHLVSKPNVSYQGSAAHFDQWARQDCLNVAQDYGTEFEPTLKTPSSESINRANDVLAGYLAQLEFAEIAIELGTNLWKNQAIETPALASAAPNGMQAVSNGNALRESLGHYQGAMFYFDGEWFWGIDRIRLLETRLVNEGYGDSSVSICVPEPTPNKVADATAKEILLEYFPSLRSPYTAVGHQRVLDLIERSGVRVEVRPVMPMLMRGVPAPRAKQRYIITDAAREARAHDVPFGKIVDPFGMPVKRAFALFPGAQVLGRAMPFVTAYLNAAWHEGTDITTEIGLRQVVENAGMEWRQIQEATKNTDWEAILSDNLDAMLAQDLWGVPSFRVSGGNQSAGKQGAQSYACWGQDRIWRVENEIAARI